MKKVRKPAAASSPDVQIENHGSIFLLRPITLAVEVWMAENLPMDNPETQFWAGAVVVEPRYIGPILEGIQIDGLRVQ